VNRFFGSLCRGCDKLAYLFFSFFHLVGWFSLVGPSREKRLTTRFFRFRLSRVRQISRFLIIFSLRFESRKAPHNSISFRERRLITRLRG